MSASDSVQDEPEYEASRHFNPAFIALGYFGLVPFLMALIVIVSGENKFGFLPGDFVVVDPQIFFVTYSIAILSFLAGTLWQQQFFSPHGCTQNLVLSNAVVVTAWVALVAALASKAWIQAAVTTNMLGFLFLLARERKTMVFDPSYRRMRHQLTCLVALMHFLLLMYLRSSH